MIRVNKGQRLSESAYWLLQANSKSDRSYESSQELIINLYPCYRVQQEPLQFRICDRKRRLRKSLESGAQEGKEAFRYERNGEGENHLEALGQLRHERKEVLVLAPSSVSSFKHG